MTLWTVAHRLICPWDSLGKNTGVGSHSLLQGIFLIQGSNLGLLHCRQILYHLSHQESPLRMAVYIFPFYSLHSSHPFLPYPTHVHKSVLYQQQLINHIVHSLGGGCSTSFWATQGLTQEQSELAWSVEGRLHSNKGVRGPLVSMGGCDWLI